MSRSGSTTSQFGSERKNIDTLRKAFSKSDNQLMSFIG